MYYEEQWVDGALCWRTSPTGAWTRYTANELAHRYESAEKRAADAQATVEALQRERDEWRSNAVAQEARANNLERDCKDLLSDIDGERAKVGDLLKKIAYWEKRHHTYRELAEENMNLKSDELSALQGLVRALQRERDELKELTSVICGHCCEPMAIPSRAVLQAALDAEREKVANTEKAYQEKARLWIEQTGALSQLQALVRVYFTEPDPHKWIAAYQALKRIGRTLDATPTERGQG